MQKKSMAYIFVALAILVWGSVPAVGKMILANLSTLQVMFYSSLMSTIVVGAIVFSQKRFITTIGGYHWKDFICFFYLGFIGTFMYCLLQFAGLKYTSAQEANIINYTWPIWIIIFSIFILKLKLNWRIVVAIILSFVGIYIAISRGSLSSFPLAHLKGNIFALMAAVCYGFFGVAAKKYHFETFTSMFFYFLVATVLSGICVLIFSFFPLLSLDQIYAFFWLGGISNGLGFVFWFLALKHGDIAKMSNIIFLTPFAGLVFIYFINKETIYPASILGLILIIFGIVLQQMSSKKEIKNT
ncbi:MAG TPA: DMT family transporter [Victivallales bacterium]|nr:DMT family transporter [Victivallales bacterium]